MADKIIVNTEEMVGSGHPTKSDTLNRALLIGHNTDGTHNSEVLAAMKDYLPWAIFIDVFPTAKSNVNWNDLAVAATSIHCGAKQSSGAQNDSITWDILLAAGTWSIELLYSSGSNRGIYSIQFNSVEKGTIDGYSAGAVENARSSITGIVVSTTAKIELKLKMATKNASSSGYYGSIVDIRLMRTA